MAKKKVTEEKVEEIINQDTQEVLDVPVKTIDEQKKDDILTKVEGDISNKNTQEEFFNDFEIKNKSKNNPSPNFGKKIIHEVFADIEKGFLRIAPGEVKLIQTGLFIKSPVGTEVKIRTSFKVLSRIRLNVIPVSIDSSGKSELIVPVQNLSSTTIIINDGQVIGEMLLGLVLDNIQ